MPDRKGGFQQKSQFYYLQLSILIIRNGSELFMECELGGVQPLDNHLNYIDLDHSDVLEEGK